MFTVTEGCIVKTSGNCGLRLRLENGETLEIVDVDPDETVVQQFLQQLIGEQLDGEQLLYLAEDWINGAHGIWA